VLERAKRNFSIHSGSSLKRADLLDGVTREPALGLAQVDDVVVEGELLALVGDDLAGSGHAVLVPGNIGTRLASEPDACGNSESDYRDYGPQRQRAHGIGDKSPRNVAPSAARRCVNRCSLRAFTVRAAAMPY
jgi:hypothetical protein